MVVSEHSINAKLLYALLLNRTMLSQKSGWVSEDGNVYVIYTIKQMANDLNWSERTVKTALCELENAGLLTRVRQGLTKANRLFLQIPDGLKYCGKCHTPKEAFYPADLQAQGFTKHPVMCKCAAERREREESERREYERMSYMTMLRSEVFRDMPAADWRFEADAVTTPQLAKARGYAQNWDEFKKAGIGLLLFGNVGTGKSYAAGCIANALIDRLESVLFVGMSDAVNRMQGNFGSDRDRYMKSLMRPDLLRRREHSQRQCQHEYQKSRRNAE